MWDRYVIRRKANSFARRAGWTRAPAMPIFAWVGPTSRCNLHCRICYLRSTGCKAYEDMSPRLYERVRREVLPGLRGACLTDQGEPFLAPVFYELLDATLGAGKFAWIITNGTIVRTDALERLVRSPSSIRLSLDGTTAEVYEYVRRGAKFDRVMEFMRTVKALMDRAAHPHFQFEINFVITRSSVGQMTECVELAHRFGVCRIYFLSFIVGDRRDEFAHRESLVNRPEEVRPHWERARRRGDELGVDIPPIAFDSCSRPDGAPGEQSHLPPPAQGTNGRIRPCPLPWWETYIDVDGSVRPCCAWPVHLPLGNLNDQSFRRIWNGPQYRALRRTVNTPPMPDPCRHCNLSVRL